MTSLGIGTLRWGLVIALGCRSWLADARRSAADAPAAACHAGGRAATAAAPPARASAAARRPRPRRPSGAPPAAAAAAAACRRRRRLGRLHRAPALAREERQRAEGADLPHQGAAQPPQGDRARRRHRRLARDHPPQERDGQLVPADQGGVRARRRADLREERRYGRLAEMQEFDVYNGAIQPGSHTLSVALHYQGNGFGVFSYLKGYKFNVKSSHTFVAGESKTHEHHGRRLREGQHHHPALRQAGGRLPRQRHVGRRERGGSGGGEEVDTTFMETGAW